jgi:hypothetical protein
MTKIINFLIISFLVSSAFAADEEQQDNSGFRNVAIIRTLNKSTAKSSVLELPLEQKVKYGSLTLIAHKCWQAPLDQKPESKLLLEILEEKNVEGKIEMKKIFYGWMFASSPSISSMEHAIYDVNVLSCKG